MKNLNKKTLIGLSTLLLGSSVAFSQPLKQAGSPIIYLFATSITDEMNSNDEKLESASYNVVTGSKAIELFCSGMESDLPSIANVGRQMKQSEFDRCQSNGVKNITQGVVGFDGIAVVQAKNNQKFDLTKKELALALAEEVPDGQGGLVVNPYKYWSDINPNLPKKEIKVYGPVLGLGTRDVFEEMVITSELSNLPEYTSVYEKNKDKYVTYKKYKKMRQDGVFITGDINFTVLSKQIAEDSSSVGILAYSYLEAFENKLNGIKINNITPTQDTIAKEEYPLSRRLYFYVKNDNAKNVPMLNPYGNKLMSEEMIGKKGSLVELGLVPLQAEERAKTIESFKKRTILKKEDLPK